MIQKQSWEITDEFWEEVKNLIPEKQRDPNKEYKRAAGAGRKPMEPRKVLEAIFYVLRTGIQWKALPKEKFGASSSIHRYFMAWCKAGVFENMWKLELERYNEIQGIDWEWLSIDGSMNKAPLQKESVGANPTDWGKKWDQKHILVDDRGVPLSVVVTGANRHDVSQLEKVLNSIVTERPEPTAKNHQNLCADNGYIGEPALEIIVLRGYIPHVVSRGEEKKNKERNPGYKARRWVVEVTHSWMNRFRKLLVRFEKTDAAYLGLIKLACAFIAFRKIKII